MSSGPIASAIRSTLVCLALCVAAASGRAQDSTGVAHASLARLQVGVLHAGDVLRVAVYREKEFSGEFLIDTRGNVQIPGLGDISVGGSSPTEVRERIRDRLRQRGISDPDLSVEPLIRVSVLGEVKSPGIIPVEPGTSLLQMLARAGGPSDRANLKNAQVIREGRTFKVDLKSAFAGAPTGRYFLYSNDVLYIPREGGLTRERWQLILGSTTALISIATFLITLSR